MINDTIHIGRISRKAGSVEGVHPKLHDASVARVDMSFGKIVRKIVKKWLKRDTEPATPEPSIDYGLNEDQSLNRLSPEPCMFCIESDGACSGDLNRNVHLSDATGFTGDGGHWKCIEYGFTDLSSPFASESTERSCDAACRSSQAPAPVCVCEACYIFRGPNLPSAISISPRIATPAAAAAAGQPIADADFAEEEFCPYRCDVNVDSRFTCGKFLKSGVTSSEMENCGDGCRKSSVSLVSLLEPHVFTADCIATIVFSF